VAVHLRSLSADRAQRGAHAVLKRVPEELRAATENGGLGSGSGAGPARGIADSVGLHRICDRAVRRLIALPAASPSLRLLADQTAETLAGISHALNGLALLADHAYDAAIVYMIGTGLATSFAALVKFAVLPQVVTYFGFSIILGLYLVPTGALIAQPRHPALFTAMAANFVPLLAPANEMNYDTEQFYNSALRAMADHADQKCHYHSLLSL